MKQFMIRMILAAAAVLSASGAHAEILKATVPFQFYMNGALMPAGSYEVRIGSSPSLMVLRNADARKLAVSPFSVADVPQRLIEAGKASMLFDCSGPRCVLFEVWQGSGNRGAQLSTPKLRMDAEKQAATKKVRVIHAD